MDSVCSLYGYTKRVIAYRLLWRTEVVIDARRLKECFKNAEKNIQQFPPNILQNQLSDIWKQLRLLYHAYLNAFNWFKVYKNVIPVFGDLSLNFASDSHYNCTAFLTPTGEFDDMKWVQRFIDDEQKPKLDRFYFACFYCFEFKIRSLWQQINDSQLYYDFDNHRIRISAPPLVKYWIYFINEMENEVNEMLECEENGNKYIIPGRTFTLWGLENAILKGNLGALRYIWGKLSAEDRDILFANVDRLYMLMIDSISYGNINIMHFLYSQLTVQQQLHVLQCEDEEPDIWKAYLYSPFYMNVLEQITQHQNSIPPNIFSVVLSHVVEHLLKRKSNPFDSKDDFYNYETFFCKLWCLGSSEGKEYALQNKLDIIDKLVPMKKTRCIKIMLKDSTFEHKRKYLFVDGGVSSFLPFVEANDWTSFKQHLMLFLIDLDREYSEFGAKRFHDYCTALLIQFEENIFWEGKLRSEEQISEFNTIFNNLRPQEIEINNLLSYILDSVLI